MKSSDDLDKDDNLVTPQAMASKDAGHEVVESKKPTLLQVIFSVMAAFVGIQNKKNKERDFKYGNFKVFVAVAATFTLIFLVTIITIVQIVIGK